ncbi:MAG: ABC transporter permease subunit [Candidatus Cloacimonetes bacterium]|nr:ABC transporter permease subunit [Candidatus Cloacimonadota bacterium]
MNSVLTIARREFSAALRSISTYIIFTIFLVICGILFAMTVFKIGKAELRFLFELIHYAYLFYIPAITMGSLAKERSGGTLELLMTLPLKTGQIIAGKFTAAVLMLLTVILCTLVFYGIVWWFGYGIDYGAILSGYLGIVMAGAAYIAIGIFASSIQSDQVLAFILAFVISAFFCLITILLPLLPVPLASVFQYISFGYHLESFYKGVLDSRDIIWFLSISIGFLLMAEFNLKMKNRAQER